MLVENLKLGKIFDLQSDLHLNILAKILLCGKWSFIYLRIQYNIPAWGLPAKHQQIFTSAHLGLRKGTEYEGKCHRSPTID